LTVYEDFVSCTEAALLIEKIRTSLKMRNEFVEIADLLAINTVNSKEWTLAKMDKQVERTLTVLDKLNDKARIDCLKQYVNSIGLINWLRENVQNLKEFKFLVELASLTPSGEYAQNNSLFAKTLKEAGIAYAPLIFDLKLDDDFQRFSQHCEVVWMNLKDDPSIAEKLSAVKDKVELLEKIKNKKGKFQINL
jgi:hypothetical protein